MGFGDREVTVRLGLAVRDYTSGAAQAEAADRRMLASQMALGASTRKLGDDLDALGRKSHDGGVKMGKSLLIMGGSLAALGAAGGGIKLLPPLLGAAGTAAGALPGIFGGAAASAVVLKVGLGGVGKELGKLYDAKDPFTRLAPNAVNFLRTANQVKPVLIDFKSQLQQRVTQGLGADLELFATKTLPAVQNVLNEVATDWAETFAEMALAASDPEVLDAFNVVTGGADKFFDQVNMRIRPTAQALATLATESQPVADAVGRSLVGMLDKFATKVEEAKRTGSLKTFFEAGAESAREMLQIAGNVGSMIGSIVREVQAQSAATGEAADSLNAYVASGRAAEDIAGVVHTLTTAYEGLSNVLGPIGGVLRDALADPGTAASIEQMFAILSAASQVVSSLLQTFLALNSASGGTILTLIALGIAIKKMSVLTALATAAAAKGAASLQAYGGAAAVAGSKMTGFTAGVGKALTTLMALQVAHELIQGFQDDAANIDLLTDAIGKLGNTGQATGELTRLFGENLNDLSTQLVMAGADDPFANFLRSVEKALPITRSLAELFGAGAHTFTGSAENFAALDQSLTDYVTKTGDVKGAQEALNRIMQESGVDWFELREQIPQANKAMEAASTAAMQLETGTKGLAERQALLNAPLEETVTLARSLLEVYNQLNGANVNFAQATAAAEAAVDGLQAGLAKNGLALADNKREFDLTSEKGRKNLELTTALTGAAAKAAQAKLDDNGTVEQAAVVYDRYINQLRTALAVQGASPATINAIIGEYARMPAALEGASAATNNLNDSLARIPKGQTFTFNGESIINAKGETLELEGSLKGLPQGKTFRWDGKQLVDGKGKAYALKEAIQGIPSSKAAKVSVPGINKTTGQVEGLAAELQGMPDGLAAIHVQTGSAMAAINQVRQSLANLSGASIGISNRHGGVYKRAAAGGLVQAQVAPPGTLYQWAEPETQGEAFIPRKGNRKRGRAILGEAAGWYGMRVVPMAAGGIQLKAAAAGLVNIAPKAPPPAPPERATRLDYAESYTRARDAVKSLNTSLKENGRAFSQASVKGRENRTAVYQVIRAAQDAAETKFKETGSVRLANKAYDEHIARLRATLKQQKVNATTIRSLLSLASRPKYDLPEKEVKPPTNSAGNVALARSLIAVAEGSGDLADKLSLNTPGVATSSQSGRDNLSAILDFLGLAERVAQDRYGQTKNAKLATAMYDGYIAQLRKILREAGYSTATINSLINSYGRITLSSNATGGIHHAAAGLMSLGAGAAGIYPSSSTLYGFAEPGTGGEAFIPRNGERRRGRELVDVAAGWYGGRFVAGGGGSTGSMSYDYSTHMTVNARQYTPSAAELLDHQRTVEAHARTGRRY